MTDVAVFPNPFNPREVETVRLRRPMTVRRFVGTKQPRRTRVITLKGRRVREFTKPTVCMFNGQPLMRAEWSRTLITERDAVCFVAAPPLQGGGGGGGGSNPAMIVVAIAILALTIYLGPLAAGALGFAAGSFGAAVVQVGVGVALAAVGGAIMSLFATPPQSATSQPNVGFGGAAQTSPTYSLQAQGNAARLGQPVAVAYGRNRIFPAYVGEPYVRYAGNKQYIHALLGVTQGEFDIEEVRIGETPVGSFESIEWAVLEPGEEPDTDIVDPRWLVCKDIAQIELTGAEADPASPWRGPFAANPAGTTIDTIEIDLVAPRGLYKTNSSGTFDTKSVTVVVELREIDDLGEPLGDWAELATVTKSGADATAQRWTETYEIGEGRWQVRLHRTDTKDTTAYAGHEIDWVGLRGRLLTQRRFADMTCLQVRMEASGDLNGQTSRQVNVIGTRKLPTWAPEANDGAGAMTTEVAPSRSPCDALADVLRNTVYGARLLDSRIDLAGLYANLEEFEDKEWSFDFVFDTSTTAFEAVSKIANAVNGVVVPQGGKVRLVRDVPTIAPAAMFTPRNIRKGSWSFGYKFPDENTPDGLIGTYIDPASWKEATITVAMPSSPQARLKTVKLEGIQNREQGRERLWYLLRGNYYRRRTATWRTEMDGMPLLYGDPVSFSLDVPKWGQSAEILDWNAGTRTATLSEDLVWLPDTAHFIKLRKPDGMASDALEASAGAADNQVVIGAGELPTILTGGDSEKTYVQFGPGQAYAKPLLVLSMRPSSLNEAEIVACDDDPRMHEGLPVEFVPPPGVGTDPLEVHITADVMNGNLRTYADAAGYSGLRAQAVTIILDAGVTAYSTDPAIAALMRGSWPFAYQPTFINRGTVIGEGGRGGGGGYNGVGLVSPQAGGTALDARSGPLKVDNSEGVLRGGGGGGGAGQTFSDFRGGEENWGAGGGGHSWYGYAGSAGTAGSPSAHGVGGGGATAADGVAAGAGGAGGASGSAGTPGSTISIDPNEGFYFTGVAGPQPGGAAGKAADGNGNIEWVGSTGTRVGVVT